MQLVIFAACRFSEDLFGSIENRVARISDASRQLVTVELQNGAFVKLFPRGTEGSVRGNGGVELGHMPFLAEDSRLTDADHVVGTPAHACLVLGASFPHSHSIVPGGFDVMS